MNFNFAVFSDNQFDSYNGFPTFGPSRKSLCSDALKFVGDYCFSNQIKHAICTGDLLDKKSSTPPSILHDIKQILKSSFSEKGIQLFILSGNHDFLEKASVRSMISILEDQWITDCRSGEFCPIPEVTFYFVSDVENKLDLYEKFSASSKTTFGKRFLFSHVGIWGAMLNSKETSESEVKLMDLHPDSYDRVFLGDYHRHQYLIPNQTCYVGALLQKNFGEEGNPQHFAHVRVTDSSIETTWVPLPDSFPVFRTVEFGTKVEEKSPVYLKVRSSEPHSTEEIEHYKNSLSSKIWASFFEVPLKMKSEVRMDFSKSTSFLDQCCQFIREKAPPDLDKGKLESILKEII